MSRLKFFLRRKLLALIFMLAQVGFVYGQTSTFTYQGRFTDGGTAANGTYDMQFKLFDEAGNQIGSTITNGAVTVVSGVFTVQLDYGAASFPGANRFLELGVRLAGSGDPYTVLAPRQQLTSTPYALRSATTTKADSATVADTATKADSATKADTATTATNATQLGGVAASQFVQTNDSRLTDARTPTPGSSNYIQNANAQQPANFNINGNGTAAGTLSANVVNAGAQYNLGGDRFLIAQGPSNTMVGLHSGAANTGSQNSFFGFRAGNNNTIGVYNTFVGSFAGRDNMSGSGNAFFGSAAGLDSTGDGNSFFGSVAGYYNVTGNYNTFFGDAAGLNNTTGSGNTFLGRHAGDSNTTGKSNTLIGHLANVGTNNLDHATAIGADAVVGSSNEIVLGRADGSDEVRVWGTLRLAKLGSAGSVSLCRNSFSFQISTCSSSLRYKTNIQPFIAGLAVVNRLRPITFDWKQGGMHDVGFGAEEVAAVEPLLVTLNDQGEVEGVKYDRISVALVNAVKEQQQQLQQQRDQLQQQQRAIEGLKKLVCRPRHGAICR